MDAPFTIHRVGQWRFALFSSAHADGGLQGLAEVHDGFDKLCDIKLPISFPSENALSVALSEMCLAWLKDWDARRLAAIGPDGYPSLPL